MSYFAVLKNADLAPFQVINCHINLWLMRSAGKARTFLDVGIALSGDIRKGKFRVAIPLRTAESSSNADPPSGFRSLHSETRRVPIATLIWGEHVAVATTHNTLAIGRNNPKQLYVAEAHATKKESLANDTGEVWDVEFVRPEPDERNASDQVPTYVRLRFLASNTDMLVQEIDDGTIVDLRIADTRNVPTGHPWAELAPAIVNLNSAQIFVIAPSAQQLVSHYPSFQYIRVLESKVWNDYLSPQPDDKMTVYYWKKVVDPASAHPVPISEDAPFRGFMSITAPVDRRGSRRVIPLSTALQASSALGLGIIIGITSYVFVGVVSAFAKPLWAWVTSSNPLFTAIKNVNIVLGTIVVVAGFLGLRFKAPLKRWIRSRTGDD